MTNATETTVASTETIVTPAAPAAPKAPSKKSLAVAIFATKLAERAAGKFASNKEFRAAVLRTIESELGVSTASAATMFNAAKIDAEAANPDLGLGRDPKVVKVKAEGAGKRGRPAGSVNKKKEAEVVVVTDATAAVVEAADAAVAAEATAPAVEATAEAAPEAVAA